MNNSGRIGGRALCDFNQGAAEQRHAPDREGRGSHPQDAVLDALNARRVMPGVMPLLVAKVKNMPKDWSELISFYQGLESGQDWHYVSMEKLIQLILRKRDVKGIYPFTSHAILCLTRYKTFDEWVSKPRVSIKPASADYYWFSLTEPLEDSEIYRERSESISCRYEYALKAYDKMMEKLARLESDEPREA